MDREKIIQMARDAGGFFPAVYHPSSSKPRISISEDELEVFAAAIRSATKEEDAKICDDADKSTHPADLADAIRASK